MESVIWDVFNLVVFDGFWFGYSLFPLLSWVELYGYNIAKKGSVVF